MSILITSSASLFLFLAYVHSCRKPGNGHVLSNIILVHFAVLCQRFVWLRSVGVHIIQSLSTDIIHLWIGNILFLVLLWSCIYEPFFEHGTLFERSQYLPHQSLSWKRFAATFIAFAISKLLCNSKVPIHFQKLSEVFEVKYLNCPMIWIYNYALNYSFMKSFELSSHAWSALLNLLNLLDCRSIHECQSAWSETVCSTSNYW